jgi:nitrogen fixation protein FixH
MNSQAFDPRRSRWIPWVFVGGMLLVVVVNGVLIFSAISTFTGVSVGRAYDKGRTYNHVLREAARQDALGWTTRVSLDAQRLTVTAQDRDGVAIAGLLEAHMLRPLDGQRVDLPDARGSGRFMQDLPELRAGLWEFRGLLTSANGQRHDLRQRFTLP